MDIELNIFYLFVIFFNEGDAFSKATTLSSNEKRLMGRRQGLGPGAPGMTVGRPDDEGLDGPFTPPFQPIAGGPGAKYNQANLNHEKFTTLLTTTTKRRRSTPLRMSFKEDCDYLAYYCLKAYDTGKLCGRSLYYIYRNFENYCMLDYVNCMERYELWQVVHMGECYDVKGLTQYIQYPYWDDYFLDQYYILEDA